MKSSIKYERGSAWRARASWTPRGEVRRGVGLESALESRTRKAPGGSGWPVGLFLAIFLAKYRDTDNFSYTDCQVRELADEDYLEDVDIVLE